MGNCCFLKARTLQQVVLFSMMLCVLANDAGAQQASENSYPSHPIRVIVAFAAGGGSDIVMRLLAQRLTERFGQQVVVDNRPGAGGIIGAELASKAAPNGYTYALLSSSHTVFPALRRDLPYDIVKGFAPVTRLASSTLLLAAGPMLHVQSVGELIAAAKAAPRSISYASIGNGSISYLSAEVFKSLARIDLLEVPYKGIAQAALGLLAGEVAVGFFTPAAIEGHVQSGRIRLLASSGTKRIPNYLDVPTMAEAGVKNYEFSSWLGVFAPAGTSPGIISRMYRELRTVIAQPEVGQKMTSLGYVPDVSASSDEFARDIRRELDKWARVVQQAKAKVE